ncbi:MAG: hypothetical protein ABEI06_02900, partial [Halobacteriaceae archaeon]
MGYRRLLLTQWSRRDRLAVIVIVAVTATLVGITLIIAGTGAQITQIVASVETGGSAQLYTDIDRARRTTDKSAIVFPIANATISNGENVTILGVPELPQGR